VLGDDAERGSGDTAKGSDQEENGKEQAHERNVSKGQARAQGAHTVRAAVCHGTQLNLLTMKNG
jgi:hypothetical protein